MEKNLPAREGTAKQAGKTGKYLKYAIGEIVLVVIGILIAINLNNSNQQKTLKKSVAFQLSLLKKSVYQDSLSMQGLIEYSRKQIKVSNRLLQLLNEPMNEENCEEFIANFSNHLQIRTDIADRSIYDEMVGSGAFSKIDKQELKSQIANYYQLSEHFDNVIWLYVKDFREFNNKISTDRTISRSYFDMNSQYTKEERCAFIKTLIANNDKKLMLENYFYSGIDAYMQIAGLYSVLLNSVMTGLPEKPE